MKNKNKTILSLILSFNLLFSCSSRKKDISLFIYNGNDTFISALTMAIINSFNESSLTYNFYDAQLSQLAQNENIVSEIDNNSSQILVINLVDRLSASAIIEKAVNKSLPLIFFNREPLKEDLENALKEYKNIYYVGTDPTFEGKTQADFVNEIFESPINLNSHYDRNADGKIQLVLLKGEIGHQDTENRSNSVLENIEKLGYEYEILNSSYCEWNRDAAYTTMSQIYSEYSDKIELVIANNDDMAIGAIDYLLEEDIFTKDEEHPFEVIGVDGTAIGLQYINNGYMYGTVKNKAEEQAQTIHQIIECLLTNKDVKEELTNMSSYNTIYVQGKAVSKNS